MFKILLFLVPVYIFCDTTTIYGKVIGISDGDTLSMLDGYNQQHKIRLSDIDAPEKAQDFGKASKKNLSNLCFGKNAKAIIKSQDRYNRDIATVYCDGVEANYAQVKTGHAWFYDNYSNNLKYKYAELYARANNLNLWSIKNVVAPWEYRRK